MLRLIALLTIAATSLAASVAGRDTPEPAAAVTESATMTLSCGGYDAEGEVVNPSAVAIGDFETSASAPEVPEICGGYTEDGVFIGDD